MVWDFQEEEFEAGSGGCAKRAKGCAGERGGAFPVPAAVFSSRSHNAINSSTFATIRSVRRGVGPVPTEDLLRFSLFV